MFQGIFKSAINDANKNYIFGTGSIPIQIKTAQLATFADGTTKQQGYQVAEVNKLISTMLTGWDANGNKPKSMSDNYLELILSCDNGFVVKKRLQFPHIIAWQNDNTPYNIADIYKQFSIDNWLKADDFENPDITLVVEPTDEILTTSTANPPEVTTTNSGRFYLYYRNLPIGVNRIHIDFHIKTKTEPIDFDLEVVDGLSWKDAQVILASNAQAKINVLLSTAKDVYKYTGAEGNFEEITMHEWNALYQQIISLKPNNKFTHDLYFYIYDESKINTKLTELEQEYGEVTDTTTEYESVEGVVYNGIIQVITAYPDGFHSKPFWCKRGDVITIIHRRNSYSISALYKTDESESYFETLIHGTTSQSYVKKECYIQEDGWYGVSGRTNSFIFSKKSISDGYILKATSRDGIKKTIDLTITNDDVVIGDAPVCQFIGSRAYSIKGNSNKTIKVSLSETPIGRCFSVGLRIPYATQDVAKVTINGLSYPMASSDERTASGKSYQMEGDHYHRYNFDTRYTEINSFDIVVESEADWEIMLSANCIVDDELDCCPVMIGYDLTENYNGYFDYNGESINVYELHKRLNIPYYIAIYKGMVITIQEVQDAIDSGLAEVVFYSGGPNMTPLWNKTDGSFAEKLWQDKCAVGIDVDMNVLSQNVIDRNIYRNLKNAGFKILRHLSQNAGKFSAVSDKYGDNDIYIAYGYGLGTSIVLPNQLRFPLIMFSHGIGTSIIPDDPYYPSHYVDFDGTRTINTLKYLKSQEKIGEVKCLKPSDWFAYIKG